MIQGTSKPSLILKRLPVIRMATGNFPALSRDRQRRGGTVRPRPGPQSRNVAATEVPFLSGSGWTWTAKEEGSGSLGLPAARGQLRRSGR